MIKTLFEAFETKRNALGETKFSKHTLDDEHIKKAIAHVAKETGLSETDLKSAISEKAAKFENLKNKAPLLYSTIYENIIESETFKLLEKHNVSVEGAPEWDEQIFLDLVRTIKIEHSNFFPLRNLIDKKMVRNEQWIIVPSRYERNKEYNDVDTAAATPTGTFIFNKHFCQNLLNWGFIKGIKPKSKKYKCNGGKFPNEYAYIEFLIIHEIMHYTQGEWHYQKLFKESGQLSNWVGDFRSNYVLTKSGYEQIPVGLFSDHINYDRQGTMREMYNVVKSEFEKLNKGEQDKIEKILGDLSDDHSKNSGDGPTEGEPTEGEMEANAQEIESKISQNAKEAEETDKSNSSQGSAPSNVGGASSKSGKNGNPHAVEKYTARPALNWKQILAKLVADAVSSHTEDTYQKINRRSITSIHVASQTGAGAIKPGERTFEDSMKLVFLLDCSGSMSGHVSKIFANVKNLLKANSKQINQEVFVCKFSDNVDIFRCDITKNTAVQVDSLTDTKSEHGQKTLNEVLESTISGGTVFGSKIESLIHKAISMKMNVIVISDSDIINDTWKSVALGNKSKFYSLFATESDFINAVAALGTNIKTISYMEK